jgi:hypothetical protein
MGIQVGKHRAQGRIWVCLVGVLALPAACGGRTTTEADGGAQPMSDPNTSAGGSDEGGSGPFPICPPLAPAAASPCAMPADQGCSYHEYSGGTWSCTAFVCSSGKWLAVSGGC